MLFLAAWKTLLRYRGATVTAADVRLIKISSRGIRERAAAAVVTMRGMDWRQSNGALRDMVCRGLMSRCGERAHRAT